jgi:hypothetical protein
MTRLALPLRASSPCPRRSQALPPPLSRARGRHPPDRCGAGCGRKARQRRSAQGRGRSAGGCSSPPGARCASRAGRSHQASRGGRLRSGRGERPGSSGRHEAGRQARCRGHPRGPDSAPRRRSAYGHAGQGHGEDTPARPPNARAPPLRCAVRSGQLLAVPAALRQALFEPAGPRHLRHQPIGRGEQPDREGRGREVLPVAGVQVGLRRASGQSASRCPG